MLMRFFLFNMMMSNTLSASAIRISQRYFTSAVVFFNDCMSRFLYELFYGILCFKGNENPAQVIVISTSKLTIIEGCEK